MNVNIHKSAIKDLKKIIRNGESLTVEFTECKRNSIPEPEFKNFSGGFIVIFHKVKQESSQESSQEKPQKILDLISANPEITINLLAKKIGISDRTIKKHIFIFKEQGVLMRIGSTKKGKWLITETGKNSAEKRK